MASSCGRLQHRGHIVALDYRLIRVICCKKCSGLRFRDKGKAPNTPQTKYLVCLDCGERYKVPLEGLKASLLRMTP